MISFLCQLGNQAIGGIVLRTSAFALSSLAILVSPQTSFADSPTIDHALQRSELTSTPEITQNCIPPTLSEFNGYPLVDSAPPDSSFVAEQVLVPLASDPKLASTEWFFKLPCMKEATQLRFAAPINDLSPYLLGVDYFVSNRAASQQSASIPALHFIRPGSYVIEVVGGSMSSLPSVFVLRVGVIEFQSPTIRNEQREAEQLKEDNRCEGGLAQRRIISFGDHPKLRAAGFEGDVMAGRIDFLYPKIPVISSISDLLNQIASLMKDKNISELTLFGHGQVSRYDFAWTVGLGAADLISLEPSNTEDLLWVWNGRNALVGAIGTIDKLNFFSCCTAHRRAVTRFESVSLFDSLTPKGYTALSIKEVCGSTRPTSSPAKELWTLGENPRLVKRLVELEIEDGSWTCRKDPDFLLPK